MKNILMIFMIFILNFPLYGSSLKNAEKLWREGKLEEAKGEFLKLSKSSNNIYVYTGLRFLSIKLNDIDSAIFSTRKLCDLSNDSNEVVLYKIGLLDLLIKKKKINCVINILERFKKKKKIFSIFSSKMRNLKKYVTSPKEFSEFILNYADKYHLNKLKFNTLIGMIKNGYNRDILFKKYSFTPLDNDEISIIYSTFYDVDNIKIGDELIQKLKLSDNISPQYKEFIKKRSENDKISTYIDDIYNMDKNNKVIRDIFILNSKKINNSELKKFIKENNEEKLISLFLHLHKMDKEMLSRFFSITAEKKNMNSINIELMKGIINRDNILRTISIIDKKISKNSSFSKKLLEIFLVNSIRENISNKILETFLIDLIDNSYEFIYKKRFFEFLLYIDDSNFEKILRRYGEIYPENIIAVSIARKHITKKIEYNSSIFDRNLNEEYFSIEKLILDKKYDMAKDRLLNSRYERSFIYLWYMIMQKKILNKKIDDAKEMADRILFLSDNLYEATMDFYKVDGIRRELIPVIAEAYLVRNNLDGFKRMVLQFFSDSPLSPLYNRPENLIKIFKRWSEKSRLLKKTDINMDQLMIEQYRDLINQLREIDYFTLKEKISNLLRNDEKLINFIKFIREDYDGK